MPTFLLLRTGRQRLNIVSHTKIPQVHTPRGKVTRFAQIGERLIKLPRTARYVVKVCPQGMPFLVKLDHPLNHFEGPQKCVGKHFASTSGFGHLDRVVDVADDAQAMRLDKVDLPHGRWVVEFNRSRWPDQSNR